jgi:1-phosphatidylinositol-3-phosphate 5-kinase
MEEFARNLALLPSGPSSPTPATPRPVQSLPPGKELDSTQLLSNMRHAFQRAEQDLYTQLARTPITSLNDVRRSFHSAAKGARKRLIAWQDKHLAKSKARVSKFVVDEPEWWRKGCHAIPGGNVIVREDDWGSIIAFTIK